MDGWMSDADSEHSYSLLHEKLSVEEFIRLRRPVNYIHLSNVEVARGYTVYACIAKVAEMRLQGIRGITNIKRVQKCRVVFTSMFYRLPHVLR